MPAKHEKLMNYCNVVFTMFTKIIGKLFLWNNITLKKRNLLKYNTNNYEKC